MWLLANGLGTRLSISFGLILYWQPRMPAFLAFSHRRNFIMGNQQKRGTTESYSNWRNGHFRKKISAHHIGSSCKYQKIIFLLRKCDLNQTLFQGRQFDREFSGSLDFPKSKLASTMFTSVHRFWPSQSYWWRAPSPWRRTNGCCWPVWCGWSLYKA